ncbi:MFS transporter [Lentzea albida]|uniref:Predicted arabinose efflux permease, MFS family n=1 Tax=Lentzea albida TaxID=65499 RepID=A0A1H9EIE2_9PSEU|nr:MFS transporter [Lentzea albida]SEQ25385.1 Predicted arabinose efflux permease, MFS family [Lentzea albida]
MTLWQDREFRRFWLARAISNAGSALSGVALPVLMYSLTGSAAHTAALAALTAAPYLVFGLVAGALADRVHRRAVMVVTDLVSAGLLASVPVASAFGALTPVHLMLVAGGVASVGVWFDAAAFGALPALVGSENLVRANSAVWSTATAVHIAAPSVAGVLFAIHGPAGTMALDAVSFAVSAALVRTILRPMTTSRPPRTVLGADIREGLEFLWRESTVRLFLGLGLGQAVAGGAVSGLLVVYAFRGFDVPQDDPRVGVLFSALAAGSFAATALMPAISDACEPRRVTATGLTAGVGVLGLLVGAQAWWLAVLGVALWGLTSTVVVVNGITVRQLITPDHLQGRVGLVGRMMTFGVGQPAGALAGGVLADALSVRSALVTAALPLAVAAVIGWSQVGSESGGELGHGLK